MCQVYGPAVTVACSRCGEGYYEGSTHTCKKYVPFEQWDADIQAQAKRCKQELDSNQYNSLIRTIKQAVIDVASWPEWMRHCTWAEEFQHSIKDWHSEPSVAQPQPTKGNSALKGIRMTPATPETDCAQIWYGDGDLMAEVYENLAYGVNADDLAQIIVTALNQADRPAEVEAQGAREQFENWYIQQFKLSPGMLSAEGYHGHTQTCWEAWQAGAASEHSARLKADPKPPESFAQWCNMHLLVPNVGNADKYASYMMAFEHASLVDAEEQLAKARELLIAYAPPRAKDVAAFLSAVKGKND